MHTEFTQKHINSLGQGDTSYFCLSCSQRTYFKSPSILPVLAYVCENTKQLSLESCLYLILYIYILLAVHRELGWRQQRDINRCTAQKTGKEAAQVQEPYLYNSSHLETNTVLKSESQQFLGGVFFQLYLYYICKISDVVLQYPPRTEMQSYASKEAVKRCTDHIHPGQNDSSPSWTKINSQVVTWNSGRWKKILPLPRLQLLPDEIIALLESTPPMD